MTVVQFKITLSGSKPSIWRRVVMPEHYRMDHMHQVIQLAMGWDNYHLHEFLIKGKRYGMVEPSWDDDQLLDETEVYFKDLKLKKGTSFTYLYDFGDDWEHQIDIEAIEESIIDVPFCMKGKGACPPEDCGGIWGYSDLLEVINNPKHPEYDTYTEWVPNNFNPNKFPIEAVNAELAEFGQWQKKHPKDKSSPWHMI